MISHNYKIVFFLKLANDGIKRDYTQQYLDAATYRSEEKDGEAIVKQVNKDLGDYFDKKMKAAEVSNCH